MLGLSVGVFVGAGVGEDDGFLVAAVGLGDGKAVGDSVGMADGATVGTRVGLPDAGVGSVVGESVGS